MAPYFLYRAWKHQKYLPALRQRLGALPDTLKSDGRQTIWIHSCSVGETLSVQPLAHALSQRFPDARFVFSTITKTGQAIAQERFAKYGKGNSFYFPIDLASIANKVLDTIEPSLFITIDTEIWPNVLHEAKKRGIPIVMVNGRISAESFQYYKWVSAAARSGISELCIAADEVPRRRRTHSAHGRTAEQSQSQRQHQI